MLCRAQKQILSFSPKGPPYENFWEKFFLRLNDRKWLIMLAINVKTVFPLKVAHLEAWDTSYICMNTPKIGHFHFAETFLSFISLCCLKLYNIKQYSKFNCTAAFFIWLGISMINLQKCKNLHFFDTFLAFLFLQKL